MSDALPQSGWDAYADTYETVHEPLTGQFARAALEALAVGPGERVLDVAAGPGALALAAAEAGAEVLAIDAAPGMVRRLEARLRAAGLGHARARLMDGARLALPDDFFDAVFCVFGIMVFADFRAALAEMARVAKAGGRVAIVMWNGLERMEHVQLWLSAGKAAFPAFEPPPPPENGLVLQNPASLVQVMREAGLAPVEIRTITRTRRVPSAAWFAAHVHLSPAAEGLYRMLGPGAQETVRSVLERQLRARSGDGAFDLAAEAHITVGRKPDPSG